MATSTEAASEVDPPLRVDWISSEDLRDGLPGRLGLTFLPGKRGRSVRYPGRVYRRDLAADLRTLADAGIGHLVLLVEDHELARWGDLDIVERGAEAGIAVERHPIPDGSAPAEVTAMRGILEGVARARAEGDVAVACMGGVGRTGTVAACALVDAGWSAEGAIAAVRRVRHPTAVETVEQMAFVAAFERDLADRSSNGR